MSKPGTKSPRNSKPKNGQYTKLPMADGAKDIKEDNISFAGGIPNIGPAPTSRVYTRDYAKKGRTAGDKDLVTEALGNPLRL